MLDENGLGAIIADELVLAENGLGAIVADELALKTILAVFSSFPESVILAFLSLQQPVSENDNRTTGRAI